MRLPWHVAVGRIIIFLTVFYGLMFWAFRVRADEKPLAVPLLAQERKMLLDMCGAATWASRITFDGMCETLRRKFEAAEKETDKPAEPSPEKE